MKGLLTKNLGMKLLSLLIAVFLWFYVSAVLDPQVEVRIHNVPVVVANFAELKAKNLMMTREPLSTIELSIRGSRSAVTKINNKNVTAIVDLTGYASIGEHNVPIQLNFPVPDITVVKTNASSSPVVVDAVEKKTLTITAVALGEPEAGYTAGKPVISDSKVTIEGPRSTLKLIEKAEITIDIQGASGDVNGKHTVNLFSENGVEIKETTLLTLSVTEVAATVPVTETMPVTAEGE